MSSIKNDSLSSSLYSSEGLLSFPVATFCALASAIFPSLRNSRVSTVEHLKEPKRPWHEYLLLSVTDNTDGPNTWVRCERSRHTSDNPYTLLPKAAPALDNVRISDDAEKLRSKGDKLIGSLRCGHSLLFTHTLELCKIIEEESLMWSLLGQNCWWYSALHLFLYRRKFGGTWEQIPEPPKSDKLKQIQEKIGDFESVTLKVMERFLGEPASKSELDNLLCGILDHPSELLPPRHTSPPAPVQARPHWNPAPHDFASVTSDLAATIVRLIAACQKIQCAVYKCRSSNVGNALTKHRTNLLRLLGDRSRPTGDPQINISWFLNEAWSIASDSSYALNRAVADEIPLEEEPIRRAESTSSVLKQLLREHEDVLADWENKSKVIRAYLIKGRADSKPGLDALEAVTALQTKLAQDLQQFSNFWDSLDHMCHHFSNRRIQMVAAEVKEYTDGWVRVQIASRAAVKNIKFACSSYVMSVIQ